MSTPSHPALPQFAAFSRPAAPRPSSSRTWSPYQEAIFDCLANGSGNAVVEAVAGSGKTTTLVEGMKRWQGAGNRGKRALFVCFNKSIATELERRVPAGVEAKTLHGLSYGAIRRAFPKLQKVDEHKLDDVARTIAEANLVKNPDTKRVDEREARTVIQDLCRSYGLLKGTMTNLDNVDTINEALAEYSIALDMPALSVPLFVKLDEAMRADTTRITFDEMLTFVVDHGVPMPKYSLVMVDESQDLNKVQIEILKKTLSDDGRLCAVGDSKQSCYLFRGADSSAMERIRSEFAVPVENQLPLSITYRCPRAIVAFAQEFVPHIQACETAEEGLVEHRSDTAAQFHKTLMELKPGDMAICRANAPLVRCALTLISQKRRATIKGRDIGKSIVKLATELMKKVSHKTVEALAAKVVEYQERQGAKLRAAKKDRQADSLDDKCETLLAIIDGARSIGEVESRSEMLFSDTAGTDSVVFSSIHRSKGLEADTVVWIGPEIREWILVKCTTDSARDQERNLSYVAITRAKRNLIVQPLPSKKGDGEGDG